MTAGNEDGLPMGLALSLEGLIGVAYVSGTLKPCGCGVELQ